MKRVSVSAFRNHENRQAKTRRHFVTHACAAVLAAALASCEDEESEGIRTGPDNTSAALETKKGPANEGRMPLLALLIKKSNGISCRRSTSEPAASHESGWVRIGLTENDGYSIRVTGVTGNTARVDIVFPVEFPLPSDIVTFTFTLRNVPMPKDQVDSLFWACSHEAAEMAAIPPDRETKVKIFADALGSIKAAVNQAGFDTHGVVQFRNMPSSRLIDARAINENETDLVLEINGQRITLARDVGMRLKLRGDGRPHSFGVPLRLTADGSLINAVADCSSQGMKGNNFCPR